jgi:DNA-binding FrmR family transcriptional regulator
MIEEDRWCPDIVIQVASATRALQEVAVGLLNDHLQHCVVAAAKSFDADCRARLDEMAATIRQVVQL